MTRNPQDWIETINESRGIIRPPIILPFPDKKKKSLYQLYERYLWVETPYGDIYVPFGLVTDGASVPRLLRSIDERDGLHRIAAQVHDLLFMCKGKLPNGYWRNNGNLTRLTLKQCNWIYYYLCRRGGLPEKDAQRMHFALSLGSWIPWTFNEEYIDIREPYYKMS